jgi:acetoacetyl-CoA reductase
MKSRVALVTGGVAGIGAAIGFALAAEGVTVVAVDIAEPKVASYRATTGRPAYVCNVASFDDVVRVAAEVEQAHGPVDILVNNAGITRDGMLHRMEPARWQEVIDVNLTSAFNTVRRFVPDMRQRGWGRIINISSMNGERGSLGQANYAAAKAGLIGFTKTVALESAQKGITANCIAPGFILTDMTAAMPPEVLEQERQRIPVGDLGKPEDIAAAAAFLAGDGARFITGQVISVNGGQYM